MRILEALSSLFRPAPPPAPSPLPPQPPPALELPPLPSRTVERLEALCFDLWRATSPAGRGAFCSPLSVAAALGLAGAGARGDAAAGIASLLGADGLEGGAIPEATHASLGALLAALDGGAVSIASQLWVQRGLPIRPELRAIAEGRYRAEVAALDFGRPVEAAEAINGWAEASTRGRIPEIVAPDQLGPETRLMLANAIAFKAQWAHPFEPEATRPGAFAAPGGPTTAPMMRATEDLFYAEAPGLQIAALPYCGGRQEMLILLPRAADPAALAAVEAALSPRQVAAWRRGARLRELDVRLPRFRFEDTYDLVGPLSALGMGAAFSDDADFSGITDAAPLAIDAALHRAFVQVDEVGTEAAAVTAAALGVRSLDRPRPVAFHADRPFLFLIRDAPTGVTLFIGRVTDPAGG